MPTTVRGWTCARFWRTVPAMATPAERTSSSISSKCSSSGSDADHQGALLLGLAGGAGDAGELVLQGPHRGLDVEARAGGRPPPGCARRARGRPGVAVRSERRQVRQLDPAGQAGVQHLDRGHEVEPQEGEVVEVVAGERLALEMGVDEAQAAEAADAAAQAADVGEGQAVGVAHDDVADVAVAAEQDADLAVEPAGGLGQVAGELGGDHLPRIDAAAVGALQSADSDALMPRMSPSIWGMGVLLRRSVEDRGRVVVVGREGLDPHPHQRQQQLFPLRPGRPLRGAPASRPGGRGGPRRGR